MFTFNWLGLVPLGVAVLWSKGIMLRSRQTRLDANVALLLDIVGWVFIWLGIMGPIFAFAGGPFLALALVVVAFAVSHRYRESQRGALLWVLGVATERGLPLVPLIRSFAEESQDGLSPRFHRLAQVLEQGVPLAEALRRTGNRIPTELMLAARLGSYTPQFGSDLKVAAFHTGNAALDRVSLFQRLCYLAIILLVSLGVITFMMIKIIPTFDMIFSDFDLELPVTTQWMVHFANLFASYWYLSVPVILFAVGCFLAATMYYIGWLHWEPPGLRWITRKYHGAIVMQALGECTAAGSPLPEALRTVASNYPKRHVQGLLHVVLRDIDRGRPWSDSLQAVGLISKAHAAVLSSAERVGNLPWALREMADSSRRQSINRANGVLNVLMPLLLVVCSLPVAMLAIGTIIPLASLIEHLI